MDNLDRVRSLFRVLRRRNQHQVQILHERRSRNFSRLPRRRSRSFGLQRSRLPHVVAVVGCRLVLGVLRRRRAEENESLRERHARNGRMPRITWLDERLQRAGLPCLLHVERLGRLLDHLRSRIPQEVQILLLRRWRSLRRTSNGRRSMRQRSELTVNKFF